MPSNLSQMSRIGKQSRAEARQRSTLQRISARGPFLGYVPDIDGNLLPPTAFRELMGVVARPDPVKLGRGELLRPDDGFGQMNSGGTPGTEYPLALPAGSGGAGHANSIRDVVLLTQIARTNAVGARTAEFQITPVAMTAGNGTTAGSAQFWRRDSSDDWTEIPHVTPGGDSTAASGGRDTLPHAVQFQAGCPVRASNSGVIDQPVLVVCSKEDPVYVFPGDDAASALHEYEELVGSAAAAGLDEFHAETCAVFNARVYFGNTTEAGTKYRQRIRRSAPFSANPDTALVGTGAFDLREFRGDLVRLEPLGDIMVAYFTDGIAFIRRTGNPFAPDAYQVLTTERGLLGTHAVANIGNLAHFGIFNDGWFFLDASGRFQEAGRMDIGGESQRKWHYSFYNLLTQDPDKRDRLYLHYDAQNAVVRLAIPTDEDDDNEVVWTFDLELNRVWPEKYPVTCWGSFDTQVTASVNWDDVTDTWDQVLDSWDSFGASYADESVVHGNLDGHVLLHDPSLYTRDNGAGPVAPDWSIIHHQRVYSSMRTLKNMDRISAEYINTLPLNVTIEARGDGGGGGSASQSVAINNGTAGETETAEAFLRVPGQSIEWEISGSHPVLMRGYEWDIFDEEIEPRG